MNKADFFRTVRLRLGNLNQPQVDGIETILQTTEGQPLSWRAYMLATAWHETAATMQPIRERGGEAYFTKLYDVAGDRPKICIQYGNTCAGDGPRFCGRGYVQLTWKSNYAKADAELAEVGLIQAGDLLETPDIAMQPNLAALIMLRGMVEGWFTGKRLSTYLPTKGVATADQYRQARRIINGMDKADLIEDYAQAFERALRDGGVV